MSWLAARVDLADVGVGRDIFKISFYRFAFVLFKSSFLKKFKNEEYEIRMKISSFDFWLRDEGEREPQCPHQQWSDRDLQRDLETSGRKGKKDAAFWGNGKEGASVTWFA